jgi:hypothetical protein
VKYDNILMGELLQIKTLGAEHLSKMVPGVLYPESATVVEMLTEIPLDKNKLMKLSRSVFKQIMSANKIPFGANDSKSTLFNGGFNEVDFT